MRYLPARADRQGRASVPVILDTNTDLVAGFLDPVGRDAALSRLNHGLVLHLFWRDSYYNVVPE